MSQILVNQLTRYHRNTPDHAQVLAPGPGLDGNVHAQSTVDHVTALGPDTENAGNLRVLTRNALDLEIAADPKADHVPERRRETRTEVKLGTRNEQKRKTIKGKKTKDLEAPQRATHLSEDPAVLAEKGVKGGVKVFPNRPEIPKLQKGFLGLRLLEGKGAHNKSTKYCYTVGM